MRINIFLLKKESLCLILLIFNVLIRNMKIKKKNLKRSNYNSGLKKKIHKIIIKYKKKRKVMNKLNIKMRTKLFKLEKIIII